MDILWNGKRTKTISFALLGIVILGLGLAFSFTLPPAIDWHNVYQPATMLLLSGRNPYPLIHDFHNPPWALLIFMPFAWLPENISRAIQLLITLISIAYVSWRMGVSRWGTLLILLSPPVFNLAYNGNIDGEVILGFVLPPQIGLLFLMAKPQIGIGVAIYWLVTILHEKGPREVMRVFSPVSLGYLASFAIFGDWTNMAAGRGLAWNFNLAFWPYTIPLGIGLLWLALKKHDIRPALASSPCLSPYVLMHSWIVAIFAIARSLPVLVIADVCLWAFYIYRGFN